MSHQISFFALGWSALLLLSACGGTRFVIAGGGDVYTLVNLRVDRRGNISSVNYQEHALVPVCTRVRLDRVRRKEIRFTALDSGARYRFIRHRSSQLPIENHAQRIFGPTCPNLTQASAEDRAGIQAGQVYQGMSREGVLVALGYPPAHQTPSLNNDIWHYWRRRSWDFEIHFVSNQVAGIRDLHAERLALRDARRAERAQLRAANRGTAVGVASSGGGVGVGVAGPRGGGRRGCGR